MPLLIGRAGMRQMGWTDKDAVPNAVRLGWGDAGVGDAGPGDSNTMCVNVCECSLDTNFVRREQLSDQRRAIFKTFDQTRC
jgi:hypothetical protein